MKSKDWGTIILVGLALLYLKGCLFGSDTETKESNNASLGGVHGPLYPNDTSGDLDSAVYLEDAENRMEVERYDKYIDPGADYYNDDPDQFGDYYAGDHYDGPEPGPEDYR